jgi:competence protein ComEC
MPTLIRIVPIFLLTFLVGVVLALLVGFSLYFLFFLVLLVVVFFALGMCEKSSRLGLFAIVALALFVGGVRVSVLRLTPDDPILSLRVGTPVVLSGVVVDEPDVRESNTRLTVQLDTATADGNRETVLGRALVITPRYPEYRYGDVLTITGTLTLPKAFIEDGRSFDYPSYLRAKGISYQLFYPGVVRVGEGGGNPIVRTLFAIKERFQAALSAALVEPHRALLSGLLLGGKQSLGDVWLERFQTAGIVHIVVLSGYNMTIVAEWLVIAFRFLGFAGSLAMGGLGIVLFAVMTGGGATVVRAAIMALLVLIARATGRTAEMGRALLIAGALMVAVNPLIILYDPSFQLSFLASLGLVYVTPILERRTVLLLKYRMLREVILTTIATQLTVLPLLLYQTGMLSLVALPANFLVLPLIPLTMLLGFVAGVVALLVPPLALLAGAPAHAALAYILLVAEYSSKIPYATVGVSVSIGVVALLYALLAGVVTLLHYRDAARLPVLPPDPLLQSREAPPAH